MQSTLIRNVLLLLVIMLLIPLTFAANDPGHDTLYIEETGNSSLTGNLNITEQLKVANLIYSTYIRVQGNASAPSESATRPNMYAIDNNNLYLNGPTAIYLQKDAGSTVYVGTTSAVTLNVSGPIYSGNRLVCLANGTNCIGVGNGTGNVSTGAANKLAYYASAGTTIDDLAGSANGAVYYDGSTNIASGTLPFASGGTGLSSASDDTVMVSSGAAWVAKAVPDCDDSSGNHLNYDTTANAWSCGTTSGGGVSSAGGWTNTSTYTTTSLTMNVSNNLWANSTNVGIRNTQPNATLHVSGTLNATTIYQGPNQVGGIGNCTTGNVVMNVTPTGVQCTAPSMSESDPQVGTATNTYMCYGTAGNVVECNDAGATYVTGTDVLSLTGGLTVGGTSNSSFDTNTLFVDASNGNVGIGTTAPTTPLYVNSSTSTADQSTTGATINFLDTGGATTAGISETALNVIQNVTGGPFNAEETGYTTTGIQVMNTMATPTGASATTQYLLVRGISGTAMYTGTLGETADSVAVYGVVGAATGNLDYGAITSHYGGNFGANGAAYYNYGVYASSSGTNIVNNYGVYSDTSSAGTVTNNYGMYIVNSNTPTNNYGIYQSTPLAKNYFAGNVGIGTAAPNTTLYVAGSLTATSSSNYINLTGTGSAVNAPRDFFIVSTHGGGSGMGGTYNGSGVSIRTGNGYIFDSGQSGNGGNITLVAGNGGVMGFIGAGGNGGIITLQPGLAGTGASPGSNGAVLLAPSGGNVGIGTASPTASLQVNSSNAAGSLYVHDTAGTAQLFVNGSTGRVGINTSTPNANLHVVGPAATFKLHNDYNSLTGYYHGADFSVDSNGNLTISAASSTVTEASRTINLNSDGGPVTIGGPLTMINSCIYLPGGGRLCGNSTCSTLYSPNGNTKMEACN